MTTGPQIPDALRQIQAKSLEAIGYPSASHAVHIVHFVWGDQCVDLAEFTSRGPLYVPAVGDVVRVHEIPVRVLDREISFESLDTGGDAVFTRLWVEPVHTGPRGNPTVEPIA